MIGSGFGNWICSTLWAFFGLYDHLEISMGHFNYNQIFFMSLLLL